MADIGTSNIAGAVLVSTNSNSPQWDKTFGGPDIILEKYEFNCFRASAGSVAWPLRPNANGTGSSADVIEGTLTNPGIVGLITGTENSGTSAGQASLVSGPSYNGSPGGNLVLGGGLIEIMAIAQVETLSTAGDEFICFIGIGDGLEAYQLAPGATANGVYFRYDRTSSVNWQGVTYSGGSSTVASGGSNVAVGTGYVSLRMVINAAATSVSFYVNNTLIGTSTSNINTSLALSYGAVINKTAGTNSRSLNLDYLHFYQLLTTSRF